MEIRIKYARNDTKSRKSKLADIVNWEIKK